MSTLAWIICSSVFMTLVSFVGGLTLFLPEATFLRTILPLVSLAAGTLIGGSFFHFLPEAIEVAGNQESVFLFLALGFTSFFVLEQFLHWHHHHGTEIVTHHPVSYLLLVADGIHSFIGGLALGTAFLIDVRLGLITTLVEALHEIPQEFGDFGILVNSGWKKSSALMFNFFSGLTFPLGAIFVYFYADMINTSLLLAFGAGNFLYIGAADLIPQLKSSRTTAQLLYFSFFLAGLVAMYLLKAYT